MASPFPIVTKKELKETRGEKNCIICCEDYTHGHVPVRTPCNHLFGQKCIAAWLANNDTCPMCRTNIVPRGFLEGPSRHQSSRRDEPSTRSRAETEASRTPGRSLRPHVPRIESLRHEPSAHPRAGTEASRIAGAPSRLSVSSSQWDETRPPTGSGHRSSHASRTAREAPTSSSHRSDHPSRTAREAPPSSSHRNSHTSHTAREEPSPRPSHRSNHTSRTAREEPPTRSSHRSTPTSHPASHRSSHAPRPNTNPIAQLATLIRGSRPSAGDNHTRTPAHRYPAFTRPRLLELLSPGYIDGTTPYEMAYVAQQLEESDAREARGLDLFEAPEGYRGRPANGHPDRVGRSGREAARRDIIRNMPDADLAAAIGRLRL